MLLEVLLTIYLIVEKVKFKSSFLAQRFLTLHANKTLGMPLFFQCENLSSVHNLLRACEASVAIELGEMLFTKQMTILNHITTLNLVPVVVAFKTMIMAIHLFVSGAICQHEIIATAGWLVGTGDRLVADKTILAIGTFSNWRTGLHGAVSSFGGGGRHSFRSSVFLL
jgi:hypothetical protein